jgi:hypothetical protein
MEFFAKYWDKLAAILLSTVIAGVIGFFSAVVSIKDQIGNLQMEVRTLNTLFNDVRDSQKQEISRLNDTCKNLNERMFEVTRISTESATYYRNIEGTIDLRVRYAISDQRSRSELQRAR